MQDLKLTDWAEFKSICEEYSQESGERREQWLFRGQGNTEWKLETTLDRYIKAHNLGERGTVFNSLLRDFVRGSTGIGGHSAHAPAEHELELLARHHGLPSPYMDWTQSPYVAAFFAFSDPRAAESRSVSVWLFDRDVFVSNPLPELVLVDDHDAIQFNPRAIEQRALFVRVDSVEKPMSELLEGRLFRIDLPSNLRPLALADLDTMLINDRTLFRDLDGVARMASLRGSLRPANG